MDLGRLWQIGKFTGICFWLALMLRGIVPALRQPGGDKNLLALLTASVGAIGLFYGAGFFYGERTHLTVMEYWRWWIVHLWVEGFFEVFATTALAFIFSTLGLVSRRMATTASLASASLFMLGGIPGTFHHLYFAGTTTPVMAIGASFSALEVVPLIVLGHEAWENWRLKTRAPWMADLKWPLMCFVAVAFWNMLGAGVFGFMINPPISLYYIQGLNTTPVHAHAALFGVYGFLALGFTLLVLRYIRPQYALNPGLMKLGFWGLNIGLALMIFTSLLPAGLIQFHASVSEGMWYARSEAFMQQDILKALRWGRTFGDVVFLLGALALVAQVILGLASGKPAAPSPACKPVRLAADAGTVGDTQAAGPAEDMVPGGAVAFRRGRCPACANLRQRKEAGPGPGSNIACAGACGSGRRAYACTPARWSWPCCCRCPPAAATVPRSPAPMSRLPPGEVSYAARRGAAQGLSGDARAADGALSKRPCHHDAPGQPGRVRGLRARRRLQDARPAQRGATAPDMPAAGISWSDASAYAAWLSAATGRQLRLPTYAEWVYAAGPAFIDDALAPSADDGDPAQRWLAEYDQQARRAQAVSPSSCDPSAATAPIRPDCGHGRQRVGLTSDCHTRRVLDAAPGEAGQEAGNCGIRVAAGRHIAYLPDFIRDPKSGACSVACRPPTWACGWCWRTRGWRMPDSNCRYNLASSSS